MYQLAALSGRINNTSKTKLEQQAEKLLIIAQYLDLQLLPPPIHTHPLIFILRKVYT